MYSGSEMSTVKASETPPPPATQNIRIERHEGTLNVDVHPEFINKNWQKGGVKSKIKNKNTNTLSSVSQLYNTVQARFSNFLEQHNIQIQKLSPSELAGSAKSYILANKKKTAFAIFAMIYVSASGGLIAGNHYLNKAHNWCCWKKHLSIEELHECPHHELQQNLREAILHRYLNNKTKDRLTSYMQFMNAVDKEEKMIHRYLALANIVKRSRLMRLFPVNDAKIEKAKLKKQRLAFVKHIFISWAAQQNFEKV